MEELEPPPPLSEIRDQRPEPQSSPDATILVEKILSPTASAEPPSEPIPAEDTQLKAVLEAVIYLAEEPLSVEQIASGLARPRERVKPLIAELLAEYEKPEHGIAIREVAGGYIIATKPEHHEAVRDFVKSLKPPLKLSLPALETLAVIAYKQPVTAPEIMEIRGVQGASVLKTLLERRLIAAAGRKNVIGRPILYRTTKEFLVQFGLNDLSELPSLKEFEEIRRMAIAEEVHPAVQDQGPGGAPAALAGREQGAAGEAHTADAGRPEGLPGLAEE